MRLYLLSLILVFCIGYTWAYGDGGSDWFNQDACRRCKVGEYCAEVNGIAKCLKAPIPNGGIGGGHELCGDHYCQSGYKCESKHGHYICRRKEGHSGGWWDNDWDHDNDYVQEGGHHKNHKHHDEKEDCNKICGKDGKCKHGQYCAHVQGVKRCVYYPDDKGPQCGGSFCRVNQICVLQRGVLGCLENPDSSERGSNCGLFHCEYNEYCILVNGYLQCLFSNGSAPFACGLNTCVPPELCVVVDGASQCVAPPRPLTTCGPNTYCKINEQCIRDGFEYRCVPKPLTCDELQCARPQLCILVDGSAQCVTPPASPNPLLNTNAFAQ